MISITSCHRYSMTGSNKYSWRVSRELGAIQKVVIAEYQLAWGPDIVVTQRYGEALSLKNYQLKNPGPDFCRSLTQATSDPSGRKGLSTCGLRKEMFKGLGALSIKRFNGGPRRIAFGVTTARNTSVVFWLHGPKSSA